MASGLQMGNGLQNGVRTNHERDPRLNGHGSNMGKSDLEHDKGKALGDMGMVNGGYGAAMDTAKIAHQELGNQQASPAQHRMDELPEEIQHITTDIMPLSLLLTRLAQMTHNATEGVIATLASKPLPDMIVNGNSDYRNTNAEDTSPESLEKKRIFLEFLQAQHTRWVKALVLTEWSKKSEYVGKLIDIRSYLATQLDTFPQLITELINVKRDLHWARLPSPDLKTALQILDEGEVSFLQEFGYIEPPPIPPEEILRTIESLNTTLNVRLCMEEFQNMPTPFKNYRIGSGRVTFTVEGEFELDLTVADEDFDSQFWFIDLRLIFRPAPQDLPPHIRAFLEQRVNDALQKDGLAGCYKLIHEFVLTLKVTEFYNQALALSRSGRWAETLKVERLNRAMSFQYWKNKYPPTGLGYLNTNGPQSWVIVGTKSGDDSTENGAPSGLFMRWFRDKQEVKDFDIELNVDKISVEDLLTTVIARHVEHHLRTIQDKFLSQPRFVSKQASLALNISRRDASNSFLSMKLFDEKSLVLSMEPVTGRFLISPVSPLHLTWQRQINLLQNVGDELPPLLEKLRCIYTAEEMHQRARTSGWTVAQPPIKADVLKTFVASRELYQAVWMKHRRLPADYYLLMTMSLGGDRWWMVQVGPGPNRNQGQVSMFVEIPLKTGLPSLSDTFLYNLLSFFAGILGQMRDKGDMKAKNIQQAILDKPNPYLPSQIKVAPLSVRLVDLLHPGQTGPVSTLSWAGDSLLLYFVGIHNGTTLRNPWLRHSKPTPPLQIVMEARLGVADKSKGFHHVKGAMDRNVSFDHRTGHFIFRFRYNLGGSLLDKLIPILKKLELWVNVSESIKQAGEGITAQGKTLRRISFSYGPKVANLPGMAKQAPSYNVLLDISRNNKIGIKLEKGNPHLRVLDFLEKRAAKHFKELPPFLLHSLSLYKALDKIEEIWSPLITNGLGRLEIFPKALEQILVRYTLPIPNPARRTLNLAIALRSRKDEVVWYIRRVDHILNPHLAPAGGTNNNNGAASGPGTNNGNNNPKTFEDDFHKILYTKVWTTRGPGWKGLETGASADLNEGIENLLEIIDTCVRALVGLHQSTLQRQASQGSQASTAPSTINFSQGSSGVGGGRPSQQSITSVGSSQGHGQQQQARAGAKKSTPLVIDD